MISKEPIKESYKGDLKKGMQIRGEDKNNYLYYNGTVTQSDGIEATIHIEEGIYNEMPFSGNNWIIARKVYDKFGKWGANVEFGKIELLGDSAKITNWRKRLKNI